MRSALGASGAALLLTACAAGVAPPTSPAASRELRIGLTDYQIVAVPAVAMPGALVLTVTNAGATAHDLLVGGPEGPPRQLPQLAPGATGTLALTAESGEELRLWCSLPGHREQGMELLLPVRNSG